MRVWLLFVLMLIAVSVTCAEPAATNAPKAYTIAFKDIPGTERQYQGTIWLDMKIEQLLDTFSTSTDLAVDSWTARESVLSNDNGTATMKFGSTQGNCGAKFPGRTMFVSLPTGLTPPEALHPYSLTYTRTADGTPSDVTVLGGKLPSEHLSAPYGSFYSHLFPFGDNLKLPASQLTAGQQWEDTVKVPILVKIGQPGAVLANVKRTFTFIGPQISEGKEYLVFNVDIDTGNIDCKNEAKVGKQKVNISNTLNVSGKSTIYFDETAGEIARVTIEGTCTTNVRITVPKHDDNGGWEATTTKFSGSLKRVPVG